MSGPETATAVDLELDRIAAAPSRHYAGVHPATVSDNQDPDGLGRVQVRLPWSPDPDSGEYAVWARLATLGAGPDRGQWFVPEVGDEVLVAFGGGDPDWPYVVGSLWNGQDTPPEKMGSGNDIRSITSRAGVRITMDDTDGAVRLTLTTPGGRSVTLDDGAGSLTVADGNGNSLELAPGGVTLTGSAPITVRAPSMTFDCATATVTSAKWDYSGVVQCSTVIASAVVGSSYTPGAGNVW